MVECILGIFKYLITRTNGVQQQIQVQRQMHTVQKLDRSDYQVAPTEHISWTARIIESRPPRMYFGLLGLSSRALWEYELDRSDYRVVLTEEMAWTAQIIESRPA